MSRSIFYGFGAWIGQLHGPTRCSWWPNDPNDPSINWDPQKLISSDLDANPHAIRTRGLARAQLEVDDKPGHGGLTRLGPTFPLGSLINSIWLEQSKYDVLPPVRKPPRVPPNMQCRDYELCTVLYWDDQASPLANRRFWGLHAEIVSEQGANALVSIWPPGRSQVPGQLPLGAWWLDLSVVAHPIEAGLTQIGVGPAAKQGALFLDGATYTTMSGGSGPKLPASSGGDLIPRMPAPSRKATR
ncbi:MAG: hypothetical protein H0T89_35355 [Deltaproteobacteria bacterium]|nr:hypothetical protein [Deltaproteobacteria bacterium]MDQ3301298.1 hypothetical protein [Myxococcota bacterium]